MIDSFKETIWNFYASHGRDFFWRTKPTPYHVVVSEIMLQQTQTYRVAPKFAQFIEELPSFETLAQASLRDVLSLWQGLGYNRRGMYLQKTAQKICTDYNGQLPNDPEILVTLPGIGQATAASICAFTFNNPTVFIETNIRAVFIYFFFKNQSEIHDKQLMPLIEKTVDQENPREWYYALMDYGVMLKQTMPNPSRKSRHHTKQSKFEGSDRQIRGAVVRLLTQFRSLDKNSLIEKIGKEPNRVEKIVEKLISDQMISVRNKRLTIYRGA